MFRQMFLCRWVIEVLKILRDQDKDICAKWWSCQSNTATPLHLILQKRIALLAD